MEFIKEVIGWYQENKRDLPWRKSSDPYIIWLSEIILQQTRVEQGLPYFQRFSEAYPTVSDFAGATEDEILQLWQGLGYYSRGRNMHKTARMVMEEHEGYFPKTYNQLIKLKGIGEYTAAAISSFASNEAQAVVDGNVFRLLSRFYAIKDPINSTKGKRTFTDLANQLIDKDAPGVSNQAMMEFGSIVCRPRNPACHICPLSPGCCALKDGLISELPVKLKAAKSRDRFFNYIVAMRDGKILLTRRVGKDIWEGLYEFPLIEATTSLAENELVESEAFKTMFGEELVVSRVDGPVKHVLSHQNIYAKFFFIGDLPSDKPVDKRFIEVDLNDLKQYAKPKLVFAFVEKHF